MTKESIATVRQSGGKLCAETKACFTGNTRMPTANTDLSAPEMRAYGVSAMEFSEDAGRRSSSEEKYWTLLDRLPDVVCAADPDGQPFFVNSHCKQVSGYPRYHRQRCIRVLA